MEEDKYRSLPILKERRALRTHAVPLVGGVRPFDYSTYQEYERAWNDELYKEGYYKKLMTEDEWKDLRAQRNKEQRVKDYKRGKRTQEEIEEGLHRAPKKQATPQQPLKYVYRKSQQTKAQRDKAAREGKAITDARARVNAKNEAEEAFKEAMDLL
jgi:hypothetical protein